MSLRDFWERTKVLRAAAKFLVDRFDVAHVVIDHFELSTNGKMFGKQTVKPPMPLCRVVPDVEQQGFRIRVPFHSEQSEETTCDACMRLLVYRRELFKPEARP